MVCDDAVCLSMEMSSDADQNLLPSTAWVLGKLQHELDPSYQHLSDGHTAATQPLALLEAAEQAAVVLTLETYRDWRQTQAMILQNRGIDPHESSKNPLYKNALLLLWKSLLTTLEGDHVKRYVDHEVVPGSQQQVPVL